MLELLNTIAQHNSPKDKVDLLKAYEFQEELKTILKLATDPFITFGATDFEYGLEYSFENPYYVLNQMANRELTGGAAKAALGAACADLDDSEKEVIRRILRKDLRCGLGEKLVLNAFPGLIQQFEVMRAEKLKSMSSRGNYYVEPKYDGLRCIAVIRGKSVTLYSRNGKEFTSSDHLKDQLLAIAPGDGKFDGELISGNFNQSSSAVRRKNNQNDETNYHIFDWLSDDEWNNPIMPYTQRRATLSNIFKPQGNLVLTPSYKVCNEEEALSYYGKFLDSGYEGAIVKNGNGLYRFKRHKDWMKIKEINEVDLVVESLVQGEGKYHGMLGAVIVKFKGKRVNVGSGWSDEERELYWSDPNLILRKVVEIHYHQETPDGSLRHPRFARIREDKSVSI